MISKFLKIPLDTDPIIRQKKALALNGALFVLSSALAFIIIVILEIVFDFELPIPRGPRLIAQPFLIVIPIVIVLLRYNRLNAASWLLVVSLFLGESLNSIFNILEGLRADQLLPVALLVIVLAGMLLGRYGIIFFTLATNLTVIGTWLFEAQFLSLDNPEPTQIILFVVFSILLATIINTNNKNSTEAIQSAQETARALINTNQELQLAQTNMEERIVERTADIERRANYLEAASEVGQAATSIYSLEELLDQVGQFISERFGFYQVGIFMLDDLGEYAVLRAANSPGGKQMLARNHQLKVGAQGIVGYVTSTGQARVALDTGEDAHHFNTPELPNTRSEMALPLFAGGRLFGALDVQSTEQNAFSEEDVTALRVLADQVAMAINNAQLFEQLQKSLDSERLAYGEVSHSSWLTLLKTSQNWGYRFADQKTARVQGEWAKDMTDVVKENAIRITNDQEQPTLALPIQVGGGPIGVIRLQKEAGQPQWIQEEIDLVEILVDRLSQSLDSARLYQNTQLQAAQEQLTGEISTKIRESLDIDTVLRTAAQELGEAFKAKEVIIRMNPQENK